MCRTTGTTPTASVTKEPSPCHIFDNVVVKDGKVVLIGETKSGKAVLSNQQKRFFNEGQEVTFVGDRSAELGIKGRKISNKTVETQVTTIPVTKL